MTVTSASHFIPTDNCSPQVYRFMPKEGTTVTTYGQFTAPPINVCVVDGILYNFSHDDLCDGRVVEVMELEGGDLDTEGMKDSGGKEGTPQTSSSGPVHSKEVWRGNNPGHHMFSTLCPAESTFSLGTFPLLKLQVWAAWSTAAAQGICMKYYLYISAMSWGQPSVHQMVWFSSANSSNPVQAHGNSWWGAMCFSIVCVCLYCIYQADFLLVTKTRSYLSAMPYIPSNMYI